MYEYTPKYTRKKEGLTLAMLLSVALLLLAVSRLPQAPLPSLWQLAAVILLTAAVLVAVRFLLRSYTVRLAPREDVRSPIPDLTVVERMGRRTQTVCRVSLADVVSAEPITPESKAALRAKRRGKRVWLYYAEMNPPNLCQLTVMDGEECVFILLQADEKLLSFLQKN